MKDFDNNTENTAVVCLKRFEINKMKKYFKIKIITFFFILEITFKYIVKLDSQ